MRLAKKAAAGAGFLGHATGIRYRPFSGMVQASHGPRHPEANRPRGRNRGSDRRRRGSGLRGTPSQSMIPEKVLARLTSNKANQRQQASILPSRRSRRCSRSKDCEASRSAAKTMMRFWKSSRNPDWGVPNRAGQISHPYRARRAPLASDRQVGHRRLGERTVRVATTASNAVVGVRLPIAMRPTRCTMSGVFSTTSSNARAV